MIKHKNSNSIPYHIELHKINVDRQIDNIKEILEVRESLGVKKDERKETKINFTVNQKYQIIK